MATTYQATGTYSDKDLNSTDQAKIKAAQDAYIKAQQSGDTAGMSAAHANAEAVRKAATYVTPSGYSGGTDGSEYNPYATETPTPLNNGFPRTRTAPDTQAMYEAAYAAQKALIDENYNNTMNKLKNSYNENTMNYDLQQNDIESDYTDTVKSIGQQTYENLQRSKEVSSARGIMNSAMGRAQDQGFVRSGSESVNTATTERDKMLNDLSTRINNLTQTYNNDLTTLEASKGAQLVAAQQNALSNKLNADMNLYQFDTQIDWNKYALEQGQENAIELANLQNKFNVDLSNLSFEQQKVLTNLSADAQARLAYISQSGNMAMFNKELEQLAYNADIEHKLDTFSLMFGEQSDYYNNYSSIQKSLMQTVANKLYNGTITLESAINQMNASLSGAGTAPRNLSSLLR